MRLDVELVSFGVAQDPNGNLPGSANLSQSLKLKCLRSRLHNKLAVPVDDVSTAIDELSCDMLIRVDSVGRLNR